MSTRNLDSYKHLGVKVHPDAIEQLRLKSLKWDLSVSQLVRKILSENIDNY